MKKQHVVINIITGETKIQDIEVDPTSGASLMEQLIHDCPDCRAALARGEQPLMGTGEDLNRLSRGRKRQRSKVFECASEF